MGIGSAKLVKAGFVVLDATGAILKIVAFQYNPEIVLRRLDGVVSVGAPLATTRTLGVTAARSVAPGAGAASGVAAAGGLAAGAAGAGASGGAVAGGAAQGAAAGTTAILQAAPHETISFTIALDAADKLEAGDPATQQNGLFPALSALELLMYPTPGTLTVWVSGSRSILPVRINEMQIVEQAFDPALNPIRAEVAVTLMVLEDADLANDPHGRAIWDAHFAVLQQMAKLVYDAGTLAALGLTGI